MTHAVCTPGQRRAYHLNWTLNPLLGIFLGIEVARFGGQGARPTIHLAGSDRFPCAAFLSGMNKA